MFRANDNEIVGVGDKANKMVVNLFKINKSRKSMYISNIGAMK